MQALIYTRVSQDRAGGRSPQEQENEARAVCERENWTVVDVVTDSLGASRHSKGTRTGWAEARRRLADGSIDVLVTWEASRAQRDLAAYTDLRDLCTASGVLWSYGGKTHDLANADDRFTTGLDALMAEREADEIAHRVQRAIRANAEAGRPHGRLLDGYRRIYNDRTGTYVAQVLDEERAPIIASIYEDFLGGFGVRPIATRLNERGAKTHTGMEWNDAQVRAVLRNPGYAARRKHQGAVVGDGDWPPIVDPADFDRVQARFAATGASMRGVTKRSRLLTSVARCGVCGGKIHAGHDRRNRKVYSCRAKFCVARDMAKLDDFVSRLVIGALTDPSTVEALAGRASTSPEAERAIAERDTLKARLDDAVDQFTQGDLTATTLARIETSLNLRIKACEETVRRSVLPVRIDVPETGIADWWESLGTARQREVVGALVTSVEIFRTGKGVRTFRPESVRVTWA